MTRFDATSAKNRFGQLLEASAHAPVAIERHGRVVAYVVAPGDFHAPPRTLEDRLAGSLRAAGAVYVTLFGSLAWERPGPRATSTSPSVLASR